MSGVFSKSILRVGSYHSPQGVVEVTPSRLRHWEETTRQMQAVGYALPTHFNHIDDFQEPIAMDVLQRANEPAAEKTVGRLREFRVAPDGQSAEITLEALTPLAREKVESNSLFISPVIHPVWKDGAGNEYQDVITCYDLVDWPVDYSQTSFVPAVQMGLQPPKPFVMSVQMADENDKADDSDTQADDTPPPAAEDKTEENGSNAKLSGIISALANLKVVLAPDTNGDNFIDRLESALLTAAAATESEDEEEEKIDTTPISVSDPQIATMSVAARAALSYAERSHRNTLEGALQSLVESGRCTPAEFDARKRSLAAVKLSLDSKGEPIKSRLEDWIEDRAKVPAGTFWTDEQRTEASTQRLSLVEPPSQWGTGANMSQREEQAAVDQLTKHRKR